MWCGDTIWNHSQRLFGRSLGHVVTTPPHEQISFHQRDGLPSLEVDPESQGVIQKTGLSETPPYGIWFWNCPLFRTLSSSGGHDVVTIQSGSRDTSERNRLWWQHIDVLYTSTRDRLDLCDWGMPDGDPTHSNIQEINGRPKDWHMLSEHSPARGFRRPVYDGLERAAMPKRTFQWVFASHCSGSIPSGDSLQ